MFIHQFHLQNLPLAASSERLAIEKGHVYIRTSMYTHDLFVCFISVLCSTISFKTSLLSSVSYSCISSEGTPPSRLYYFLPAPSSEIRSSLLPNPLSPDLPLQLHQTLLSSPESWLHPHMRMILSSSQLHCQNDHQRNESQN